MEAVLVIDDATLGPGVGGVRTWRYPRPEDAALDATRLARAMTIKCSLAGLDAGGAKMVVLDQPGLRRKEAFRWLGAEVQALGGAFRTAGDLGTTDDDLAEMAKETEYVHREDGSLAAAVAEGLWFCLSAALRQRPAKTDVPSVLVQGAGAIGSAVARRLSRAGMRISISDLDRARAERVAAELGARTVAPERIFEEPVDVFAPCAIGGVIDRAVAESLPATTVVGAANNVLASKEAGVVLHQRGVLFVPDPIASAGAVIAGISRTVMGLLDPTPLLAGLGETTGVILAESQKTGRTPTEIAEEKAWARIEAVRARGERGSR